MSSMDQLKREGTWIDRIKYILSLPNKTDIEKYLKQSTSYDDLQMLVFLSKSTKNEKNLLEIFQSDSLPVKQRIIAGKGWLKIQRDEKQIFDFVVKTINEKNIPRNFKCQILDNLHQIDCLKKSTTFFYQLACHLTEFYPHHLYDLDAYLLPFCSKEQIFELLSRWSIRQFEQIDSKSLFYTKLIYYQPLIVLHLIECDLNELKGNKEKFVSYFRNNSKVLSLLAEKQIKAVCRLTIEYLNQLEEHQRFLPSFIESKQKYFFKKVPNEMIELITIVASYQPGIIKYKKSWCNEGADLDGFHLPRAFSLDHYNHLFCALYDTCKWSTNHTIRLLKYMLQYSKRYVGLYSCRKRRKWLYDFVVEKYIGKELFLEKLLNEGDETTLALLDEYSELTTPLSLHLISQYETNRKISAKQRLSLIRYQSMTQDIFDQFLKLLSETSSNENQRTQNYILFLQCAFSTSQEKVHLVLQWIQKRFMNEKIMIIRNFLSNLSEYNIQFLPDNFEIIEGIIDIMIKHQQRSDYVLQTIVDYGLVLLQRAEYYSEQIQTFACQIIKRCFAASADCEFYIPSISKAYPTARHLLANILVEDIFPKLITKGLLDQLNILIGSSFEKAWQLPQIDAFLSSFFIDLLPSSIKLQAAFEIDKYKSMISFFLKNRSTQFERANQLIQKIGKVFLLNEIVQRIAVYSQQHRPSLIDQLIEDNKCLTFDKLANEHTKLPRTNLILPGLNINILNSCFQYFTGQQQEHITKIILYDYLPNNEVTYPKKLKSLRALRHFTYTYTEVLQWFKEKQTSSLLIKTNRGVKTEPFDNILICLPVLFDLTPENFLNEFDVLKKKLNASNAKYISDAMLIISRKLSEEIFRKSYLQLVHDEHFQRLGITATKEILRLLIEYASDSNLITIVIKPIWDSRPHPDVRACLILTLLHFLHEFNSNDDQLIIWKILEEAADDDYLPVVQSLFAADRGSSRWPLSRLRDTSNDLFQTFINRIQFKILDHPNSLEARLWAWSNIDYQYCDQEKLIRKAQQLCLQFDRDGNTLWAAAFNRICSFLKSHEILIDIIQKLMFRREEFDLQQNACDNQHDLPVYHRIHHILTTVIDHRDQFNNEENATFRSLALMIFQFDKTFAILIGRLLIQIAENREDLQSMLILFQENLPENYYERVITDLSKVLSKKYNSSSRQKLSVGELLDLAQWFIKEKDQGLFVFDLLKSQVFKQVGDHRQQCQDLIRELRQSENCLLRQKAMEYTVTWKAKKSSQQRSKKIRVQTDPADADIDFTNIFNSEEIE